METQLVLSNTCTFFGGRIEAVFKKAHRAGFKYLEIIPYRWLKADKVFTLEKKYNIQVAGIHMPQHWELKPAQIWKTEPTLFKKIFGLIWHFYMGSGKTSPGLKLTQKLHEQNRVPYLLFHSNAIQEINQGELKKLTAEFHVVIENVPFERRGNEFLWNPITISQTMQKQKLASGIVFDPAHYEQNFNPHPPISPVEICKVVRPEVIHIGYVHSRFQLHVPPNEKEQKELREMTQTHKPKYVVIETNPSVDVNKTKILLEKIINSGTN